MFFNEKNFSLVFFFSFKIYLQKKSKFDCKKSKFHIQNLRRKKVNLTFEKVNSQYKKDFSLFFRISNFQRKLHLKKSKFEEEKSKLPM